VETKHSQAIDDATPYAVIKGFPVGSIRG